MDPQNYTVRPLRSTFSARIIRPGPDTDLQHGPDRSRRARPISTDSFLESARWWFPIHRFSLPPKSRVSEEYDHDGNHTDAPSVHRSGISTPTLSDEDVKPSCTILDQACSSSLIWKSIWIPLVLIQGAMLLILGVLVVVIVRFRMQPPTGSFQQSASWSVSDQKSYLVLRLKASWLAFIIARGPQFAFWLTAPMMQLWTWKTVESMVDASDSGLSVHDLPTTHQFSLIVGICMASLDSLRSWTPYHFKRGAPAAPTYLNHAALVLFLCLSLGALMFSAETLISDTITTTVGYDTLNGTNIESYGRGLSSACLSMDRVANAGYPCTSNILDSDDEYVRQQNEVYFLDRNSSQTSEMRTYTTDNGTDIAFILPKTEKLSAYIDYRASSIGITTNCTPISQQCVFAELAGVHGQSSTFSCGPKFYGMLGATTGTTAISVATAPFAIRSNEYLTYAFFTDDALTEPYNSAGYDATTGLPVENGPVLPDSQLVNEVYVAFAARFRSSSLAHNADPTANPAFLTRTSGYVETVLKCSYKALHVEYTWFNGTIVDFQAVPAPNGTISETWHGLQAPPPSLLSDANSATLQSILTQAAAQTSAASFAQVWALRYSYSVLSTIGAVVSSRSNIIQQERIPILLTCVSIPALALFGLCCILYMAAGFGLAILAVRTARRRDLRDARARLTLLGVVDWPVGLIVSGGQEDSGVTLSQGADATEEQEMVGLKRGPKDNYYFKVFERQNGATSAPDGFI